ncbi:response regulator [Pelagicoccus sp. SDUM812002]|uniref:response regulator n=1 Tax=Pelagicoccus sp. SDUM812002 TaxID=3041266 RepID=UPI00280CD2A4|nr:response regulator [Pelagicoccus sp. SDUM812002]MDQ8188219.1 response regulator [Pelagicoccus sp. SDUM812002]
MVHAEEGEPESKASVLERPKKLVKRRALVVDDIEANRVLAARMLEELNCEVDVAGSGVEAIEKARGTRYDVVFMDLRMPVVSGIETVETIRKECPENTDTCFIALSAFLSDSVIDECEKAGIGHYISKPIVSERMADVVSNL